MHLALLLAFAGQVSPTASPEAVDARGAKDVVFRAPATGMYRVRVTSDAGTSCAIADHLRGPFAFSGEAGTKSCDADLMLEASLYKARLRSPDKGKGKAKLDLIPFSEVMAPVRLDEGRQIETRVKPREQVTTWLRAEKRQSVTVEVAGRTVGRIGLWRDGQWLEDAPMDHVESVPRAGKAIHRWRMDRVLEPGDYKLVIYGSEAKAWTKGPEEDVAFITRGAPAGSAARSQTFSIPAWGFTQIALPYESIAAFVQLDQSGSEPVRMRAEPVRKDASLGPVRSKGGSTCTIAAGAPLPSCSLTESAGTGGTHILTIEGPPGTRGDLMWGPMARWDLEGFWWNGNPEWHIHSPGPYLISAPPLPMSMDAEPLSCAIDQITEDRGHFIRRVAIDAPAVSWTTPFERAFNYSATSTAVWLNIEKPGLYEIKGEDPVKASCEIFKIDGWNRTRVGEGEDGKCNSKKALSSGIHEIRFYGGRPGIQKLRVAQLGLGGMAPATQPKASCTFPNVELTPGRYRLATSSSGGANLRALMARPTPGALDVAVPFALDPGRPLTLSLTAGGAIVARTRAGLKMACTLDSASVASSGGVCQSGPITAAAGGTLTITNNEAAPILVMVGRVQPPPPVPQPPRFDPVTMKLPTITSARMQWMDFAQDQQRSMIVTVDKPGLYDLESEGLLSTTCRLRTPTIGNLAEGNANGRGRNCLVRAYLKPGTYLFTAQTQGSSEGRAGIRLAQRPPRDLGAVPMGDELFFRVPAGELAQQTFELKKASTINLATSAHGASLSCRFDDHDGWPLTTVPTDCSQSLDLAEGRYLLTALPLTVDSRRRTSVMIPVDDVVLAGESKTHALALNKRYAAQLGTDGKDSFTFTLGADMEVGIELTRAMQGRLSRVGKDAKGAATREVIETVPPVGGGGGEGDEGEQEGGDEGSSEGEQEEGSYEGDQEGGGEYGEYEGEGDGDGDYARRLREQREEQRRAAAAAEMERATAVQEMGGLAGKTLTLAAGTYILETEHSRGDVAIRYDVRIGVRTLAPGVVLSVPVPGRIDVAMPAIANAQAGLLRIKTRGDVDVRCRLRSPDGTLVAESADSGADWNCALAVPLGAGRYTLSLEAETLQPGMTELSASFLEAKETGELKDGDKFTVVAKVAAAPIAPADASVVHDVVMTSSQDFSCAVQDDKGAMLDRKVSVRECRFLLWPGEEKRGFRVFVWTPDRKADVKVALRRRGVRGFGGGGIGDDVVGRAKIDVRGRYATGNGALCRPVSAGAGVLAPCNGAASFVPGEVLVATTQSDGGRVELGEQIAQLAAQTTEKRALTSTRAAERQRTRSGDKAVHLVEVSAPFGSPSSPSCSIDGGLATHDAAVCAAATGPVEESTLATWTRSGAHLDATIARRAVAWPKEAKALAPGKSSLSWADESARFTLPNDGFRLQLALPSGGWAVLLDGSNVRDVCAPRRAPTPDRQGALSTCILRGRGGELFIASPAGVVERQARADLLVLATAEAPRALVGMRETKPSSPGRERVLVAPSSSARTLRVEGKGVLACAIHLDGGAHVAGCHAQLPANQGAEVRVEHDDRAWRVFTHAPGALAGGRYGALPTNTPSASATMGNAMALGGNVVDKVVELKQASAVRVRASSGVCAISMKDAKGWRVVEAQGLGGGCDLVRVMPAGTHRVTVRGFGTAPLGGNVNVSAEPVLALEEGVNAETLVGSGDARTYRFVVTGEGEIGVGLQADADTLSCTLFTEAQELVGDGCHQFHRKLSKGTYYLRIEAPDDTAPRRFKPVIFGLKGSVIDVPDAWLRDFFVRAGVAKSDRTGRNQ